MNMEFGGNVVKGGTREDGQFTISVEPKAKLFKYVRLMQFVLVYLLTHFNSTLAQIHSHTPIV